MNRGEEPQEDQRNLLAESGMYSIKGFPATLWLTASFARQWYEDALAEAHAGDTFQHRRREIVFAVCAVESYLFEWVRDEVLARDFTALDTYFPPGVHMGIKDRWREVLNKLHRHARISKYPDHSTQVWRDFRTLVDYRDSLVHAGVSRPEPNELPAGGQPPLSKSVRDTLPRGWATQIVARLITHLHVEIGTQPPAWLTEP